MRGERERAELKWGTTSDSREGERERGIITSPSTAVAALALPRPLCPFDPNQSPPAGGGGARRRDGGGEKGVKSTRAFIPAALRLSVCQCGLRRRRRHAPTSANTHFHLQGPPPRSRICARGIHATGRGSLLPLPPSFKTVHHRQRPRRRNSSQTCARDGHGGGDYAKHCGRDGGGGGLRGLFHHFIMRPPLLPAAALDDCDGSGGGTCRISRRKNMFCSWFKSALSLSPSLSSPRSRPSIRSKGREGSSHFLPFLHLFSSSFLPSFRLPISG